MLLEAPPRHGPLRLVRPIDAPVTLAFSDRLPSHFAARRSADSLEPRRGHHGPESRPVDPGLAARATGYELALSDRLHVRVLLRHGAGRLDRGIPARRRRREDADLALLGTRPVPPAHPRRSPQATQDSPPRPPRRGGQAGAKGGGGAAEEVASATRPAKSSPTKRPYPTDPTVLLTIRKYNRKTTRQNPSHAN